MNRNLALDNNDPLDAADWIVAIGLSALIHILVGMGFIFFSHSSSATFTPINAIDVDLSYIPPPSKGKPDATGGEDAGATKSASVQAPPEKEKVSEPLQPEKTVAEKKAEPVKKIEKVPAEEAAISLKKDKTPVKKPEEKKKSPNDEELINKALKNLEKNIGSHQEDTNPLAERFRRLANEAEQGVGGPRGNGGTADGDQTESGLNITLLDRYRITVQTKLTESWAFSPVLSGGRKNLETWVSFEVYPNGEVGNIKITKTSGNDYMDSAAIMAVKKSSPMPNHPVGINKSSITLKYKFRPNNIN
jgi:protein TonB